MRFKLNENFNDSNGKAYYTIECNYNLKAELKDSSNNDISGKFNPRIIDEFDSDLENSIRTLAKASISDIIKHKDEIKSELGVKDFFIEYMGYITDSWAEFSLEVSNKVDTYKITDCLAKYFKGHVDFEGKDTISYGTTIIDEEINYSVQIWFNQQILTNFDF